MNWQNCARSPAGRKINLRKPLRFAIRAPELPPGGVRVSVSHALPGCGGYSNLPDKRFLLLIAFVPGRGATSWATEGADTQTRRDVQERMRTIYASSRSLMLRSRTVDLQFGLSKPWMASGKQPVMASVGLHRCGSPKRAPGPGGYPATPTDECIKIVMLVRSRQKRPPALVLQMTFRSQTAT